MKPDAENPATDEHGVAKTMKSTSPSRWGLRGKLVRASAATLVGSGITMLAVVAAVSLAVTQHGLETLEQQIGKTIAVRGESLTSSHAAVFGNLVRDNALTEMQATLESAVHSSDVVYGVFTDQTGKPWVYCSPARPCTADQHEGDFPVFTREQIRAELQLTPAAGSSTRHLSLFGEDLLEFSKPVFVDGELVGTLRYGLSTQSVHQAVAQARAESSRVLLIALATIGVVALAALALGIGIALRTARRITSPLSALTQAAERLARGRDVASVQIESGDELEVLGQAFNQMVTELRASHGALERQNLELQNEIETRRQAQAERSEMQRHLIQSQKLEAFGQLAGGVAHDFNNILAVIFGNADLLDACIQRDCDPKKLAELNERIFQAASHGSHLTRQLLTFARREVVRPRVVDTNVVVKEFEAMIERVLEKSVTLKFEYAPSLPNVRVDPGRLEQVLLNLCVNARDAMPQGGTLTLRTSHIDVVHPRDVTTGTLPSGRYVVIEANDTGVGMSPEVLSRVFEPFYTTKAAGQGTGLGLATVHGIVCADGGFLDIESAPGRGSTFRVYLPCYEGADEAVHPADTVMNPSSAPAAKTHIVLCEDDAAVRETTVQTLTHAGYRVRAAADGNEALKLLAQERPDLLVTDVVMPVMNGAELAERAREQIPGLPTLFLSGYTGGVLSSYGVPEDGVHLLCKPFKTAELLERITVILAAERREARAPASPQANSVRYGT